MQEKSLYLFGKYKLDATKRILLRDGDYVPLQQKAFETLLALVERHGQLAEKSELMKIIWPETFVEEVNLAKNVSQLRKILIEGDSTHEYIETIPKRGYRFVCPVKEILPEISPPKKEAPELIKTFTPEKSEPALPPTVSAESSRRQPFKAQWLFAIVLVLSLASLVIAYQWLDKRLDKLLEPGWTKNPLRRVTNTGDIFEAAISPNGEWVTFISGLVGYQSLSLKNLQTNQVKLLIPKAESRFRGLNFSPDGQFIYYSERKKGEPDYTLYRVALSGNEPQQLLPGVDSAVSFSPDGQHLAFVREVTQAGGQSKLIMSRADGSEVREIVSCKSPEGFSVDGLSWSPDGKLIAVAEMVPSPSFHFELLTVRVSDGQEIKLGNTPWAWLMRVAWMPDQRSLAVIGRPKSGETNNQIWQVDYPSGNVQRITTGLNNYRNLSVMPGAKRMVSVQIEVRTNLWVVPADKPQSAVAISGDGGSQNGLNGVDWTPDGRIVFTSMANGRHNLWICNADGSDPKQLTFDVDDNDHFPTVSRDGKHIAFTSSRHGVSRVWQIDLDGSNPLELTHGKFDLKPNYAPQSDWLVYSADDDGRRLLKKINLSETNPVPQILSDHVADFPVISPDGKWVACAYREEPGAQYRAALIPFVPDGSPARFLELLSINWPPSLRWHPTGNALTYLDRQDGNTNVWRYSLEGGKPEKVTNFQSERIFSYAWSRDGRYLVCARGTSNQDVVLFER